MDYLSVHFLQCEDQTRLSVDVEYRVFDIDVLLLLDALYVW